jgi:ribonucleotide monophosphatase NagD (HAD superfamily)
MVGDSLHTDILGGNAAGLKTVLVTDHGMFRDGGAEAAMKTSGITPDFIVNTV